MIDKDEAKELFLNSHFDENGDLLHPGTTSLFENVLACRTIDAIYQSIGSCGECKYRSEVIGVGYDHDVWCESHQSPINDDQSFCSYFKRKET